MSHVSTGEESDASLSPRAARGVLALGIGLSLAALVMYAVALVLTATVPHAQAAMLVVFGVILIVLGITFVGLADVRRRRAGPAVLALDPVPGTRRVSRYRVRRIAAGWQALWLMLLLAAFAGVVVIPSAAGLYSGRAANPAEFAAFGWIAGGLIAFFTGMVFTSLVKKLATPALVRAHPAVTPRDGVVRVVLYFWRSDLYLGGAAFVFAAVGIQPAVTGHPSVAVGFWIVAAILLAGGVALALNFWRTGESLDDAVLSVIRTNYGSN